MKPFVIIIPEEGCIRSEDIQNLMDKIYDQGYEDGKNSVIQFALLRSERTQENIKETK